jgi:hypothetical protein
MIIDSHGQIGVLGPMTDGQLIIRDTGGNPVAATLSSGSCITITNSAGGITIASSGGSGIAWSAVSASLTASVNSGYIGISGSTVTVLLPTVSSIGDEVFLLLAGGNQIGFSQGTGQFIRFGSMSTTAGAGGAITSSNEGNSISLVCTTANAEWASVASQGNWKIV